MRYYHFPNVYHKWLSSDVWLQRYWAWRQTEFFVILDHILPFHLPNNPKNQTSEKMIKKPGDIIILHMCTKNDNHLTYHSWDVKHDRQHFLSLWTIFCPFTLLLTRKIKNFEKLKKAQVDIIILDKCTKNHDHMLYCSLDMTHNRCNWYFSFWAIFALLPL